MLTLSVCHACTQAPARGLEDVRLAACSRAGRERRMLRYATCSAVCASPRRIHAPARPGPGKAHMPARIAAASDALHDHTMSWACSSLHAGRAAIELPWCPPDVVRVAATIRATTAVQCAAGVGERTAALATLVPRFQRLGFGPVALATRGSRHATTHEQAPRYALRGSQSASLPPSAS